MCDLVLVLDKIMAEREANDRLRAEDPVAHEAKMRIFQVLRSFPSKCCPCGAREPREPARSARSEAQAKKWLVVRALLTRATRVSCVAWQHACKVIIVRMPACPARLGRNPRAHVLLCDVW